MNKEMVDIVCEIYKNIASTKEIHLNKQNFLT